MNEDYYLSLLNEQGHTLYLPARGRIFVQGEEVFLKNISYLVEYAAVNNINDFFFLDNKPILKSDETKKMSNLELNALKESIDSNFSNRKYVVFKVTSERSLIVNHKAILCLNENDPTFFLKEVPEDK